MNNKINDIIREALQILKQRQEAAQQQADIERMRDLLLDIRKDAAASHWHRDIDAALRRGE